MFSAFQKFGRLGASASAAPFSPTKLFAAGEAGGVWDFSTLANLYQDSAGTTPCTAVGQPIGLVLDTKNGTPQLGPELVTNGFDWLNPTNGFAQGWRNDGNSGPTASVVDGTSNGFSGNVQRYENGAGGTYRALTTSAVTIGRTGETTSYLVSFKYRSNYSISNAHGGAFSLSAPVNTGVASSYRKIWTFTGTDSTDRLRFLVGDYQSDGWLEIDDVSIREIPGNHLTQSTSTKRPVLGRMPATGVRNLLTYSEDFSNPSTWNWIAGATGTSSSISLSSSTDSRVVEAVVPFNGMVTVSLQVAASDVGKQIYLAIWATGLDGLASGRSTLLTIPSGGRVSYTWSDVVNGTIVGIVNNNAAVTLNNPKIQLELGSTATAYQKVGAAYDITESGVASVYTAYFDGVDDCLVSPSIDFSGTDAMSVFSGFRKTSDAARGMVAELSATTASNNGSFALTAPNAASATIVYESKGTSLTDTSATIAAPADSVISAVSDISADSNVLRRNGAQTDSDTGDQGTGNFGNYPIYVGQRGAASLPYKGFLSALCTRGAATDAATVTSMEKWLAARTPG